MVLRQRAATALLALGLSACGLVPGSDQTLQVFAAASLRDVAAELGRAFARQHGEAQRRAVLVQHHFAGSNVLARQILAAPAAADVFFSADVAWVEELARDGRLAADGRVDAFANRLAVIAHRDAGLAPLAGLAELPALPFRLLAVADPEGVPAGRYARAHLEAVPWRDPAASPGDETDTVWRAVAPRLAPALDVRAALGLVAADPEVLGVVYRTDARSEPRVTVLLELPARDEVPILYRAARVAEAPHPELARAYLAFLASEEARAIGARHGFLPPPARAPGRLPAR